MTCDVCGRPVCDDEAHWPHDRGCHRAPWCDCDTVTCPTCCWDPACNAIKAPT